MKGIEIDEPIAWSGDQLEFPTKDGKVIVIDEYLGTWDLRIEGDPDTRYDLNVTKNSGSWKVHSMRTSKR